VLRAGTPSSQVVHTLAARGAAALDQDRSSAGARPRVPAQLAEGASGLDLDSLRTAREGAWR